MNIVSASGLFKSYKSKKAVSNVSFDIPDNSLFCLIGPDGAGKSTILKIIAGVLKYDKGDVTVLGEELSEINKNEHLKNQIAFMPQGLGQNLYHTLSVEENIDFFAHLHTVKTNELKITKKRLLNITGLEPFADRQVSKLSGGMKQKLGICCALVHKPNLMILDEPTTGVDPISRKELYALFNEFIQTAGLTVVVSTSYFDEAERGNKIVMMDKGEILFDGIFEDIYAKMPEVFEYPEKDFLDKYNEDDEKKYYFVKMKNNALRFSPKNSENILTKKSKPTKRNLEDYYLYKTGTRKLKLNYSKQNNTFDGTVCEIENLVKRFGDFKALDNISLSIGEKEIFGLLGPNGAGKTTLIKVILGLLQPTSGYFQINIPQEQIKQSIGYMSQKFSLYDDLTVNENLFLAGSVRKIHPKTLKYKIDELLITANLSEYSKEMTQNIPLGIKQRLALMVSIVHDPKLIFLDEPTSGVDPAERNTFWQLIKYLSIEKGSTIIVTTHFMDESDFCDRVCLMTNGQVSGLDTPSNLKKYVQQKIGTPYVLSLKESSEDIEYLRQKDIKYEIYGNRLKIFLKDNNILSCLKFNPELSEITMEDVFVELTKNEYK